MNRRRLFKGVAAVIAATLIPFKSRSDELILEMLHAAKAVLKRNHVPGPYHLMVGDQWSKEEIAEFERRNPSPIVFHRIKSL